MIRKAIVLLLLAASAAATFEHRTDIMGGDVEPAALAGVPGFKSQANCGGSVPCITGAPGQYAYVCIGGEGTTRGFVGPVGTSSATSFTVATTAATIPVCAVTWVRP